MKQILILLLFACPVLVSAQRFNGGIIAGGLVSQVDGDYDAGFHKFGFLGGALVFTRISPRSSFQMELEYIQKGSRGTDTINFQDFLLRFHYLEVPVLYQFTFGKRFSFEAGPAVDVLLGSLEESDGIEVSDTRALRPITLSGIFGFSGFISQHLKANLRFNYSLISIRNTSSPYPPSYRHILFETGQYNNVISLSLMWYFRAEEF